ncbi:MAG: hypothetical protein EON48_07865 [Acetobacteraceae bacterium]|nr:MAG: hypothetical protein EON48_07865 [Acetobacteraceae bacterium]
MPNLFAYVVLLSWPLVAVALFRLLSLERALVWSIIAGHLLLPSETQIKFPTIPVIDRSTVVSLSALLLCVFIARRPKLQPDVMARTWQLVLLGLFGLVVLTPLLTVVQNTQPIVNGKVHLPGLRLYDAYNMISNIFFQMVPFWLGLRYLNTREGHKVLLEAFAIGGFAYSFPALLEVRISPQLHRWVYGFFPSDFVQSMRDGGFRPNVFLNHGLMVGIFFALSIVAALVLFREARREGRNAFVWLAIAVWMTGTLFLCKSLGAFALALIFGAATFLFGRRPQVVLGVFVAGVVLLYPMLRGGGLIPVDTVYEIAQSISEDRASSLKFRLDNEDALLDRANEKPVAGWGSWGRNSIFDPDTGRMTSITDGIWLIFIGIFGWLRYIGRFGLLTVPILLFALRRNGPSLITPGLIMVHSVALVDLLPNAGLVNYVWLMAGATAGFVLWRQPADGAAHVGAGGVIPSAPVRASWLMAEEQAAPMGRQTGFAGRRNRR